jgi:hypothetical protein
MTLYAYDVDFYWGNRAVDGANFLNGLKESKGLRVFWWNIQMGLLSHAKSSAPLDENLFSLTQHKTWAPHVLILGEYQPGAISDEVLALIEQKYPYQHYETYNTSNQDRGILFLSSLPFQRVAREKLGWGRQGRLPDEDEYVFDRVFQNFKIDYKKTSYFLMPVHLLNPWKTIHEHKKEHPLDMSEGSQLSNLRDYAKGSIPWPIKTMLKKMGSYVSPLLENSVDYVPESVTRGSKKALNLSKKLWASGFTFNSIMSGTDNPLIDQIDDLIFRVNLFLTQAPLDTNILVIGDFNVPRNLAYMTSEGYRRLQDAFKDGFELSESYPTFPSQESPEYFPELEDVYSLINNPKGLLRSGKIPSVKIDHAFINKHQVVENAHVLELEGSDHYPVYITLD